MLGEPYADTATERHALEVSERAQSVRARAALLVASSGFFSVRSTCAFWWGSG